MDRARRKEVIDRALRDEEQRERSEKARKEREKRLEAKRQKIRKSNYRFETNICQCCKHVRSSMPGTGFPECATYHCAKFSDQEEEERCGVYEMPQINLKSTCDNFEEKNPEWSEQLQGTFGTL